VAERLSRIRGQLLRKDKATVRATLGKPTKIGYWTTTKPPQGADAATLAAFEAATLDEIWIYTGGRVHFTLAGSATRVDDKTDRDLPPDPNIA
jgi:hypothetical protein